MKNPREAGELTPPLWKTTIFPSGNLIPVDVLQKYKEFNKNLATSRSVPEKKVEWQKHIDRSKTSILESSRGLTGKALILGMGNAMDIPLEELAGQFDELTIVEIDQEASEGALRKLPESDQKKINLIIDDLTGATGRACDVIDTAIKENSGPRNTVKQITSDIISTTSNPLNLGSDYSFVCSSLVLSQLPAEIHEYANSLLNDKYRFRIEQNQSNIDYLIALSSLGERMQSEHIDLIHSSLSPSGKAYISDSVLETVLAMDTSGNINPVTQSQSTLGQSAIQNIINKFDVVREQTWEWRQNPPTNRLRNGNGYRILALDLAPKH